MSKKEKMMYVLVFMRFQNGTLHKVNEKKFDVLPEMAQVKDKQYVVDKTSPAYQQNARVYYIFDVDSGKQLVLDGSNPLVSPEDLDIIVGQKIIKELTSGVMDNAKEKIMTLILGIVLGALAVGVILSMYYGDKINEIYQEQLSNNTGEETIITPIVQAYRVFKMRLMRW